MSEDINNSFTNKVFNAVQGIPEGKVATYGQIAMMCGAPRACRAVGNALYRNPLFKVIPCHRVVNASGALAANFVFGGKDVQKKLLQDEGVEVIEGYRIDLKKYQYQSS